LLRIWSAALRRHSANGFASPNDFDLFTHCDQQMAA
jgi:hypothetical protein